jgi:flagellar L-ring protein precursor FlgH
MKAKMCKYGVTLACAVMHMTGCTITAVPQPDDPAYAPVLNSTTLAPIPNNGGIYQEHYSVSLFEDRRAMRIGDILTVTLSERTVSSKTAETEFTKENSISMDNSVILGDTIDAFGKDLGTSVNHNREFTGESGSDQSNSLQGSIAVTVADVLPNGLLVVRGEKWMTLNSGEEFIRVKGLVRPEDVSPDNTIASIRLADARISYGGTGDFADTNKQGWASRFFNSQYWPF